MLFEATKVGEGESNATGRWKLNSGSEMILTVPALSKKPVRAVIDFASAKFKSDRIVSLYGHDEEKVVGYWTRGNISSAGIEADLHLMAPANEMEAAVMPEAVACGAMARCGVPIQVSVGAEPGAEGSWKKIKRGEVITCNGREYCGGEGDDLDLYILRGGEIFEGSIVTFGADSVTGRIAARKTTPVKKLEDHMSDKLKVLLGKFPEKYHGLVARCVAEDHDENQISTKIIEIEAKAKDDEITSLKAEVTRLSTELIAASTKIPPQEPAKKVDSSIEALEASIAAKAQGSDKGIMFAGKKELLTKEPENLSKAMEAAIDAGATERGFALRAKIIKQYPNIVRA